jgi:hypothetical protein
VSDSVFNELGLVHTVRSLMKCKLNEEPLRKKANDAKSEYDANQAAIRRLESDLGAHTKAVNHAEIIIVDNMAAYVPVPQVGYEETHVRVQFSNPKGLPKP